MDQGSRVDDRSGVDHWGGVHNGGSVDNRSGVVDQGSSVDGGSALGDNSVESVDGVSGVIHSAHGTVRLDEGVLAWKRTIELQGGRIIRATVNPRVLHDLSPSTR